MVGNVTRKGGFEQHKPHMLYPRLDSFEIYHRQTDEARDHLVVEFFIILAMEKLALWQIYLPKSYNQFLVTASFIQLFYFQRAILELLSTISISQHF